MKLNSVLTSQRYDMVSLKGEIDVIVPDNVRNQIKYLCKEISSVEWSGIIFYDTEGDINNIKSFKITLKEILPMHKGNAGSTEYDFDESVVEYRLNNEESLLWKTGHVHSHNNMGVFFSGTDDSELLDNAPNHNYYFSIIVNNRMDIKAKIAMFANAATGKKEEKYLCKDSKGENYPITFSEDIKDVVFTYDCKIIMNIPEILIEDGFKEKVSSIIKAAEPKKHVYKSTYYNNEALNKHSWWNKKDKKKENNQEKDLKNIPIQEKTEDRKIGFRTLDDTPIYVTEENSITLQDISFARYILREGNKGLSFREIQRDTLIKVLDEIESTPNGYDLGNFFEKIINNVMEYWLEFNKKNSYESSQIVPILEKLQLTYFEHANKYKCVDELTGVIEEKIDECSIVLKN